MQLRIDLHIHSCLSPCGSLDMGPRDIVDRAQACGLTHIALTDHNSTRNCPAVASLCEAAGITFLYGIEVTTAEELHLLCYLPDAGAAHRFGVLVEKSLIPVPLNEEKMGCEAVVSAEGEVTDLLDFYLSTASSRSMENLCHLVHQFGGWAVPAHVFKPVFSITSQLGFIDANSPFDALEISRGGLQRGVDRRSAFPVITSSDSHYPDDMGRCCMSIKTGRRPDNAAKLFALLSRGEHTLVF
ncbi:MAG: PHP domain-containing protein [Fibrobacterota bacterium]